jgi:hypothetical protein
MNSQLEKYVGRYHYINETYSIPMGSSRRKQKDPMAEQSGPTHLHLNESNTIFVDLETVQRAMVHFYHVTPKGHLLPL